MQVSAQNGRKFHFISFDFLSLHWKDENKKFQSDHCSKKFASKSELGKHYEVNDAEQDKKFQCNSCNKMFMSKGNLEQHFQHVHSEVKPFACQYSCGTAFKSNGDRNRHAFSCILNKKRKLHCCPICKRDFTFVTSLKKHFITIHGCDKDKKF